MTVSLKPSSPTLPTLVALLVLLVSCMQQMAGGDEDALHWLRESNTGSMVEVALSSNSRTFGFLKLVRAQASPAFTPADVALIQDVAQHDRSSD